MASIKDNPDFKFPGDGGKTYRRKIDKRGKVQYTVQTGKGLPLFMEAKEWAREFSRFNAKEKIRKIKEEKDRKIREEAEAKAAADIIAKNEKFRKEIEAKSLARLNEKNRIDREAKRQISIKQAQELENFLTAVLDQSEQVAQIVNKLVGLHGKYIKVSYLRGIAKRYFALSENYNGIDRRLGDIYQKVKRSKTVSEEDSKAFDRLVGAMDPLDKKFEALEKEEIDLIASHDAKEKEKTDKRKKATRKRRESAIVAGRKKQEAEKARNDKQQSKSIVEKRSETRQRRIQAVQEGRERQERERQESMESLLQQKRQKRESLDKFFSGDNLPMKFLLGSVSVIGAPFKAIGFDFADEIETLGTLFAPAKLAFKGIHSLSQKMSGLDDTSLEGIESQTKEGKRKGKDELKELKNTLKKMKPSKSNIIKNIFNRNKNINSNSIRNSASNVSSNGNVFNTAKSFANAFTGGTTNTNSQTNVNNQNPDLNRTDDKNWFQLDVQRNTLLEKILKALGGESAKSKSKMFGGMGGKAGAIGAGVVGAVMLGSHVKNQWSQMMGDRSSVSNVNKTIQTNSDTIIQKLKNKNASEEDIFRMQMLLDQEQQYSTNGDNENKAKVVQQRKEIFKKYGLDIRRNTINNNDTANSSVSNVLSEKDRSIIRATEIEKIEKIKEEKVNTEGLMEDFKKFLTETFAPLLANKLAVSFGSVKSGGKQIMPPANPF